MEKEKKYFAGWWVWVFLLIVTSGIILTGLSYVGIIGKTIVEREVFENSFQYSEARKTEQATFKAQLSEINYKLSCESIDSELRSNLEAQAASIRVLLNVSRSRE